MAGKSDRYKKRCQEIAEYGRANGWTQWQIVAACHQETGDRLLRVHRHARGWTLDQAAQAIARIGEDLGMGRVGVTTQRICHWEGGERPNAEYLDLLCRLYETRPDRLGFGHDFTPAEDQVHVVVQPPQLLVSPLRPAATPIQTDGQSQGGQAQDQPASPPTPAQSRAPKRSLTQQLRGQGGTGRLTAALLYAVEETRKETEWVVRASPGLASNQPLVALESAVEATATEYGATPPIWMLCEAVDRCGLSLDVMRYYRPSLARVDQCAAGLARLATLAGLAFTELDRHGRAREWFNVAAGAAAQDVDRTLLGWVSAVATAEPIDSGDWQRARTLIDTAMQETEPDTPGRVWALTAHARTVAACGDSAEALAALKLADAQYTNMTSAYPPMSWLGYPPPLYHIHRGEALLALDMPMVARAALAAALAGTPDQAPRLAARAELQQLACDIQVGLTERPYGRLRTLINGIPDGHRTPSLHRLAYQVLDRIPADRQDPDMREKLARTLGSQ